ncbi:hypothetical protein DY000_02016437 [Brassica cretica]|uniref:Uncharacterized protein n=1 Tax=Brassica cretica TaxID=69181 RepID=A0ABQ7CT33_BRACR|nr:hypothetical protein DY000_02016437 [Brassica cretica]
MPNKKEDCKSCWFAPEDSLVKCDVGITWNKNTGVNGMPWILRDENVAVLMHSRSSFVNVQLNLEAHGNGWFWALKAWLSLYSIRLSFKLKRLTCWVRFLGHRLRPLFDGCQ